MPVNLSGPPHQHHKEQTTKVRILSVMDFIMQNPLVKASQCLWSLVSLQAFIRARLMSGSLPAPLLGARGSQRLRLGGKVHYA